MEKKYNYLYKITNKLSGKFYYGVHSTDILDDNYLCSSKWVKKDMWETRYDEMKEKATKSCLIAQKRSLFCIRYHKRKHWPREAYEWLKEQLAKPQPRYNGLGVKFKELFNLTQANYQVIRLGILNGETFEEIIGLDPYQQYL